MLFLTVAGYLSFFFKRFSVYVPASIWKSWKTFSRTTLQSVAIIISGLVSRLKAQIKFRREKGEGRCYRGNVSPAFPPGEGWLKKFKRQQQADRLAPYVYLGRIFFLYYYESMELSFNWFLYILLLFFLHVVYGPPSLPPWSSRINISSQQWHAPSRSCFLFSSFLLFLSGASWEKAILFTQDKKTFLFWCCEQANVIERSNRKLPSTVYFLHARHVPRWRHQ